MSNANDNSTRLPVFFIGHGSPMNAIETNDFTRSLHQLGPSLGRPRGIVCVSAHWMTSGFHVTRMLKPRTIHDFGGFPKALFEIQYPAPGSPEIADLVRSIVPGVQADESEWGLDHGAWSVLRHVYPGADVPVVQLSIDLARTGADHYALGRQLRPLRDQGVLIMGSGNIVHNLRRISWSAAAPALDWAIEFDEWAKARLLARDHDALTSHYGDTEAGRLSVPTVDHYYPLLTVLGATDEHDPVSFVFEGIQNASISMRSVGFGRWGGAL